MMVNVQHLSLFLTVIFLAILIEMVRRKKIKERLALMWFVAAGFLMLFSVSKNLIIALAKLFRIDYAPLVIIPIIIFVGTFIGLYFSVLLSKQSGEIKKLAQEMAFFEQKLEKLEGNEKTQ